MSFLLFIAFKTKAQKNSCRFHVALQNLKIYYLNKIYIFLKDLLPHSMLDRKVIKLNVAIFSKFLYQYFFLFCFLSVRNKTLQVSTKLDFSKIS
jgi:hypothetical protein